LLITKRHGSDMKILIIEDEKELSKNIAKFLSDDNYLCEQAYDFDSAYKKKSLCTPTIVFCLT
jgi:DNA-binding response OmpR family regulator